MFTPQEIQEKTFVKAVFGGYDMQTVDEFLEPLTEDYITLYKENAVLKSKMKVLVEKLEEYRNQEATMRNTVISAQRTADSMIAEAEKKAARMMAEAKNTAQTTVQTRTVEAEQVLSAEEARMNSAKQTAQSFIESLEKTIHSHLTLLEELKKQDLTQQHNYDAPRRQKPFDYDEQEKPLVVPKSIQVETPIVHAEPQKVETAEDIAIEIEQNISRLMNLEEPVHVTPGRTTHTDSSTIKFTNLQFGPNYDPTSGK